MDDSRRHSKWQDDAVQAADTHRGLAARGRETEKKKRRRPEERKVREEQQRCTRCLLHECAEKHEDTIPWSGVLRENSRGLSNRSLVVPKEDRDCKRRIPYSVRVVRPVLGVVPASSWVGRSFKVSHPSQLQV